MKKIHVKFTSIVEVDQVFTVLDEVAEQISKRDLKSSSLDQEEQFELYEFILENNMECKNFRDLLKSLNRVRLEKVEKFETLLESIKKGESPIKIEELEGQVGNLDEIIISTSAKLDKYKGWMDINW